MIPISLVLYQIMKIYIKKHHIKPTDFLFKSKSARQAVAKAGWITPSLFPNVCWHFAGKELR